jgi:tellurite resistance protein TerC
MDDRSLPEPSRTEPAAGRENLAMDGEQRATYMSADWRISVWQKFWLNARRVVVFVVGISVLLVGIAMTVLPGPAFIVIPLGLAILATEFAWARWLLAKAKERIAEYLRHK